MTTDVEQVRDAEAERASRIVASAPGVIGVMLLGSSARGDHGPGSDIDFLALVGDAASARTARASVPRSLGNRPVQVRAVTADRLMRLLRSRSTFAVHVIREGITIHDPTGQLRATVAQHPRDSPVLDDGRGLEVRLEVWDELDWCQGFYLYCLADLYSIGRAAALTFLGRHGRFVFSPTSALAALARDFPALAGPATVVASLRPFFLLAERNLDEQLPFPYRDCHREAAAARAACVELVTALRSHAAGR